MHLELLKCLSSNFLESSSVKGICNIFLVVLTRVGIIVSSSTFSGFLIVLWPSRCR